MAIGFRSGTAAQHVRLERRHPLAAAVGLPMFSVVLPLSLRLGLMQPTGFPWPLGSHWVLPRGLIQPVRAAQSFRIERRHPLAETYKAAVGLPMLSVVLPLSLRLGLMQPTGFPWPWGSHWVLPPRVAA